MAMCGAMSFASKSLGFVFLFFSFVLFCAAGHGQYASDAVVYIAFTRQTGVTKHRNT